MRSNLVGFVNVLERCRRHGLPRLVYASSSSVFDPLGVKIARESKIDILIVDGRDLDELRNAILGKEIKGTFVDSHRGAPDRLTGPAPGLRRL